MEHDYRRTSLVVMYCFDLNKPFNLRIDEIQKNEFVYFKWPETIEPGLEFSLGEMTKTLTNQSQAVYLAANDYDKNFVTSVIKSHPVKWLGIKINESTALKDFADAAAFFSCNLIPELSGFSDAGKTASIIAELFDLYQLPFLFLHVQSGPDHKQIVFFQKVFEQLRKNKFSKHIYFSFSNQDLEEWNLKTKNTFSGLTTAHVDLSNKCTHSCVFCGIWGPDFIDKMKNQSEGTISAEYIEFMNRQMPYEKSRQILSSLPYTLQKVQFGGAGDPLTHPQWLPIISEWRSRGLTVEVLTNFEYPTAEEIEKLHTLTRGKRNFSFLINVSAATAETYSKIRPRQSKAVFEKVISNIEFAHQLRKRDGHGLALTIVNIINSQNYKEAVQMVELAHRLGVGIWLKPVEVHSHLHQKYSIPENELGEYKTLLKKAADRAAELGVELSLEEQLLNHIGASDLYKSVPCTVGYTYARFEVDGTVKPCCITNQSMGNAFKSTVENVWHSPDYYQWREKFLSSENTSSYDDYCKMCPHIPLNQHAARLLKKERP